MKRKRKREQKGREKGKEKGKKKVRNGQSQIENSQYSTFLYLILGKSISLVNLKKNNFF